MKGIQIRPELCSDTGINSFRSVLD